jgi:hypothetical protein
MEGSGKQGTPELVLEVHSEEVASLTANVSVVVPEGRSVKARVAPSKRAEMRWRRVLGDDLERVHCSGDAPARSCTSDLAFGGEGLFCVRS